MSAAVRRAKMSLRKIERGSLPARWQPRVHLHPLFLVVYFQEFLSSFGLPICVTSKVSGFFCCFFLSFANAYLSARHPVFGCGTGSPQIEPPPVDIESAERSSSCSLERANVGRVGEPGTSSAALSITPRTICGDDGRKSLSGALCL